jgi:hypothetical protein
MPYITVSHVMEMNFLYLQLNFFPQQSISMCSVHKWRQQFQLLVWSMYLYLVFKSYLTFTSAIIFNLTLIWIAGGEYDSCNFEQV